MNRRIFLFASLLLVALSTTVLPVAAQSNAPIPIPYNPVTHLYGGVTAYGWGSITTNSEHFTGKAEFSWGYDISHSRSDFRLLIQHGQNYIGWMFGG
ncbi:hypothetical protein MUP77_11260 [Candidatus Bathyarchaeota archaeon]|nr:hypothetical protein [Candidatus Bathyarchaeota archaeon]